MRNNERWDRAVRKNERRMQVFESLENRLKEPDENLILSAKRFRQLDPDTVTEQDINNYREFMKKQYTQLRKKVS